MSYSSTFVLEFFLIGRHGSSRGSTFGFACSTCDMVEKEKLCRDVNPPSQY